MQFLLASSTQLSGFYHFPERFLPAFRKHVQTCCIAGGENGNDSNSTRPWRWYKWEKERAMVNIRGTLICGDFLLFVELLKSVWRISVWLLNFMLKVCYLFDVGIKCNMSINCFCTRIRQTGWATPPKTKNDGTVSSRSNLWRVELWACSAKHTICQSWIRYASTNLTEQHLTLNVFPPSAHQPSHSHWLLVNPSWSACWAPAGRPL